MAVRTGSRELVVGRIADGTRVLGPGLRAVVWVHGCPLRCVSCLAPEDLPFEGGQRWDVGELAQRFSALPVEVTGLTLSGGEPMAQAGALAALVDLLRTGRDWSVMAFSGFTLDWLRHRGDLQQRALLDRLDILVDGPYVAARHADLLWRGSANQRLRFLTARHRMPAVDRSAGLEINVSASSVDWIGVPPVPGFRAAFERSMRAEGIELVTAEEGD